jgi:hypothetical protein
MSDIERVARWALRNAASDYAGVWLGRSDAVLYIGFVRNVQRYADLLKSQVHKPTRLHVVQMARSWSTLVGIQARIDHDVRQLRSLGVEITGTGIVPNANKVSVWVKNLDPNVAAILGERYGAAALTISERDYVRPVNRDAITTL